MVAKRKKSSMALMHAAPPSEDFSSPANPSIGPRRSSRKISKPGQGVKPDANRAQDAHQSRSATKSQRAKDDSEYHAEGVDVAMEGLREMEDNLRNAVKRQKLAVGQSSVIGSQDSNSEEDAFLPRAVRKTDVLPPRPGSDLKLGKKKKADPAPARKADIKPEKKAAAKPDELDEEYAPDNDDTNKDAPDDESPGNVKKESTRPPPVNSDYLPLPWKGRLGYACLNTYLRQTTPAVFSSRTCRIASILEHRHPLQDPSQPEHATKNRPDKTKPADVGRGKRYVESLGLANARDIVKMLRWNDKYGIKFMRLSSEMFPFASHEEYGYKLTPFASEVLAEAGKVAGELGHRLTTHPGQFTQLGSPRAEVVRNAFRDLEYHEEMLSLLRLPEQQNRDAVMILHMGGVFGDKEATLNRFRENYAKLSPAVKARLVLENDDVSWTVHDLLPICEELNIPMVLDYHHHNIMFDASKVREGTKDIMDWYPRIKATWTKKNITQKMHYSEPCSEAVTGRQRRKHSPRVMTLPPCPDDMDLMIEAKDKEQAVFNLMRNFKLPGWDTFNDIVPYERGDDNKPAPRVAKAKTARKKKNADGDENSEENANGSAEDGQANNPAEEIPESEIGMGGPESRVYWPLGMEEWLRPKKREVKSKDKDKDAKEGKGGKGVKVKEEE